MIRDEERFAHMLEAIRLARESVAGLTKEQFLANPDKKAALQHYIMVVGEAANMVSDEIKDKYPAVPWREAIGMRNIIAHAYMKTDYNRVWQTVTSDFPDLESLLMDIQAAYPWPLS